MTPEEIIARFLASLQTEEDYQEAALALSDYYEEQGMAQDAATSLAIDTLLSAASGSENLPSISPTPPPPPPPPSQPPSPFKEYAPWGLSPAGIPSVEDIKAGWVAGDISASRAAEGYVDIYKAGGMSKEALKTALDSLNKGGVESLTPGDKDYIDIGLILDSFPPEPSPTIQKNNILADLEAGTISRVDAVKQLRSFYESQGFKGNALGQSISEAIAPIVIPQNIAAIQRNFQANQNDPDAYKRAVDQIRGQLESLGPKSDLVKEWAKGTGLDVQDFDNLARASLPLPQPSQGLGLLTPGNFESTVGRKPTPEELAQLGPVPFTQGYTPPVPATPFLPPTTPFVNLPPEQQAQFQSAWLQAPPELPEGFAWMPTGPDYAAVFKSGVTPESIAKGARPETLPGYPQVWKLSSDQPPQASVTPQPGLDFMSTPFTPAQEADKRSLWEQSGQTLPFEDWMKQPFNQPEQDRFGTPNPLLPPTLPSMAQQGGLFSGSSQRFSERSGGGVGSEAAFYSAIPAEYSGAKKNQARSLFGSAMRDFQEALGKEIRGGQAPTLNQPDYFAQYPFEQKLAALTPEEKGLNRSRFAPPFGSWKI